MFGLVLLVLALTAAGTQAATGGKGKRPADVITKSDAAKGKLDSKLRDTVASGTTQSIPIFASLTGDVAAAKEFYVGELGWDETIEIPGQALFVSAGRYHHHMAMNVWNSRGAGRRQRTLGLGQVDIVVPSADELGALEERMAHYGLAARNDGRTLEVDDPWSNRIRVTTA